MWSFRFFVTQELRNLTGVEEGPKRRTSSSTILAWMVVMQGSFFETQA
jgi:hypothetical protein